jgi:hypothetical protein
VPTLKKKQRKHKINNLMRHLKFLAKQEQPKPQIRRHKEVIKIRVEIYSKRRIQRTK